MNQQADSTALHPERTFTRTKLLMMAIGTFVGSGLVSLTGPAAAATGYSVWLAYVLAVVVGFLSMLPLVYISSIMNFNGGVYTVATTFMGHRFGGAFVLLQVLNALILSILGTAFGGYVNSVFPSIDARLCGVVIIILFWAVHCIGINFMAGVQKYTTFILIAALAVFSVVSFTHLNPDTFNFGGTEFFAGGSKGIFAAVAMLVFSCQNYDNNVLAFGRYTIEPKKNMPWGILATFVSLIFIYGIVTIAQVGAIDLAALSGKPLTDISRAILPTSAFVAFIILGPILCLVSTVSGALASFTIGLEKASEDGWLPKNLSVRGSRDTCWKIITILCGICLIPIIMGVNIGILSSITTLINCVFQIPLLLSYWKLPDSFPEQFVDSSLKVKKSSYRASIIVALAARLFLTYCCFRTLTLQVAIGAVIVVTACFAFSYFRYKSGKPQVADSYFFD